MAIIDKAGKLADAINSRSARLELGCGPRKKHPDHIGVDVLDYDCVDVVGDLVEVIESIPDETVDAIRTYHTLEHLAGLPSIVDEFTRVLKKRGECEIVVPHFSNPYYYSDVTHKTPFGLYTFSYLTEDKLFKRRVPDYKRAFGLELVAARLVFKSPRPFYGRYALRRCLEYVVNSCSYAKEFYEENLTGIIACYEIRFFLIKRAVT
jgi:ubiquinone/menaquinone biosynthesis C-methylase UbiE